jgi:phage tail-like protein
MTSPSAEAAGLLRAFNFHVSLVRSDGGGDAEPLADGGFQECSGLALEADIREYLEGGRNDVVVRHVGRVKLQPIVLKRGMLLRPGDGAAQRQLWTWLIDTVSGVRPVRRYDGFVTVLPPYGDSPLAVWQFVRSLPLKVVGPTLNAQTGEIAVEELHIVHEGLRLEGGG